MDQGLWGVEVKSLDNGRVLYALNARKLMMPASNMKIVTLAAAAETLGWDYRFKTTLETTADVDNGVLKGDLIVRGTGDPTINSRDKHAAAVFDEWAAALKRPASAGSTATSSATRPRSIDGGWARAGRGTTCRTATPRRPARSNSTRTSRRCRSAPARSPATTRRLKCRRAPDWDSSTMS